MPQEALVNSTILVWARESINMACDEAAQKIGVKPSRLEEWEAGKRFPTVNQARKMSQVYRRPLAAFYLPQPPSDLGFSVPHDFRRLPHDETHALTPELITELRRIEYLRAAAIELAEDVPTDLGSYVGSVSIEESSESVAQRATMLLDLPPHNRGAWRTPYDALNGWKDAIERQGVLVMHLNKVAVDEVRGVALAEKKFPLIAVNGKDSPNGRIFTLVHEFIHLMLGITSMSNMRVARHPRTPEQRTEQFCNEVTGEILVPQHDLLMHEKVQEMHGVAEWPDEAIGDIADYFHVSREVVVRRLTVLGCVTQQFYRRKRHEYAEEQESTRKDGFLTVPRHIIRSIGQPFARIALSAYYREAISGSELAELLGGRLKHLPRVEAILGGPNVLTGGDR